MKTKIKDGDTVELKVPVRVDGYVYCPEYARRGSWDRAFMLPGARGRVVRARHLALRKGLARSILPMWRLSTWVRSSVCGRFIMTSGGCEYERRNLRPAIQAHCPSLC